MKSKNAEKAELTNDSSALALLAVIFSTIQTLHMAGG